MEGIKRNIPNIITILNLLCGLCAILFAYKNSLWIAAIFILAGSICDVLDGLIARLLGVQSEFGKQLDSFSDIVTFGVAPGVILFHLIYVSITDQYFKYNIDSSFFISLTGMLVPIFAMIRLTRFNIGNEQNNYFVGLPTPVTAIFISSFPIILKYHDILLLSETKFLILSSIILSTLMTSNIHFFSLKNSKSDRIISRLNIIRFLFLISSVILLLSFKFIAIPFIVTLYIFLSILNNLTT